MWRPLAAGLLVRVQVMLVRITPEPPDLGLTSGWIPGTLCNLWKEKTEADIFGRVQEMSMLAESLIGPIDVLSLKEKTTLAAIGLVDKR